MDLFYVAVAILASPLAVWAFFRSWTRLHRWWPAIFSVLVVAGCDAGGLLAVTGTTTGSGGSCPNDCPPHLVPPCAVTMPADCTMVPTDGASVICCMPGDTDASPGVMPGDPCDDAGGRFDKGGACCHECFDPFFLCVKCDGGAP